MENLRLLISKGRHYVIEPRKWTYHCLRENGQPKAEGLYVLPADNEDADQLLVIDEEPSADSRLGSNDLHLHHSDICLDWQPGKHLRGRGDSGPIGVSPTGCAANDL